MIQRDLSAEKKINTKHNETRTFERSTLARIAPPFARRSRVLRGKGKEFFSQAGRFQRMCKFKGNGRMNGKLNKTVDGRPQTFLQEKAKQFKK